MLYESIAAPGRRGGGEGGKTVRGREGRCYRIAVVPRMTRRGRRPASRSRRNRALDRDRREPSWSWRLDRDRASSRRRTSEEPRAVGEQELLLRLRAPLGGERGGDVPRADPAEAHAEPSRGRLVHHLRRAVVVRLGEVRVVHLLGLGDGEQAAPERRRRGGQEQVVRLRQRDVLEEVFRGLHRDTRGSSGKRGRVSGASSGRGAAGCGRERARSRGPRGTVVVAKSPPPRGVFVDDFPRYQRSPVGRPVRAASRCCRLKFFFEPRRGSGAPRPPHPTSRAARLRGPRLRLSSP